MKNVYRPAVAVGAALCLLVSAMPSEAKPLRAMVTRVGSSNQETWYVVSADEDGLVLSAAESGSGKKLLPTAQVASVSFVTPEGWDQATEALNRENYRAAARLFGKLADDYTGIAGWKDSYGARARFLQMEALRLGGDYEALAGQVDALAGKPVSLGDAYTSQLKLDRAWGYAGREAWKALRQTVGEYEAPKAGGESNPGAVPFRELPAREFVQVAFLRGLLEENQGNTKAALGDYSRAVMLSFGAEKTIARRALESALQLLVAHPDIESDRTLQGEGFALAQVYKTNFNQQVFPDEFRRFENPPPKDPEEEPAPPAKDAPAEEPDPEES